MGIENAAFGMVELKQKIATIKASNLPKKPGFISINKSFACPIIAIAKQTIPDTKNKLFTALPFKQFINYIIANHERKQQYSRN